MRGTGSHSRGTPTPVRAARPRPRPPSRKAHPMDTHSATTPDLQFATSKDTRAPITYTPSTHGHALLLAPVGLGRSDALRTLVRAALTASQTTPLHTLVLSQTAVTGYWANEGRAGAGLASTPTQVEASIDAAIEVMETRRAHGWDPDTDRTDRWVLFADAYTPGLVPARLAHLVAHGGPVGVHVVLAADEPVPGLVEATATGDTPWGWRAAHAIPMALVHKLIADPSIAAPRTPHLWLVADATTMDRPRLGWTPY
uniref:PNPL.2c n=2 Tax=Nocardiopsis sp. 25L-1-1c TaxID=1009683 RepID=R4HDD6_9ACTN|nr:pNPL.2c [Nocardiopsis sp. 25L-1-1c]